VAASPNSGLSVDRIARGRNRPEADIENMRPSRTQKLTLLVATVQLFWTSAATADDLIISVHPDEAQKLIERNEMQYEEIRWHSFPDRVRIARIEAALLHEPEAEFSISPFSDIPPVIVKSKGLDKGKWTGIKTRGGIPESTLRTSLETQGLRKSSLTN